MRQILFILALAPLYLLAQEKMIVYDEMIEERSVHSFSEIQVDGGVDLYISQDPRQKLIVSAVNEAWRNRIITEVEGSKLRIYTKYGEMRRNYGGGNAKMKVYISVSDLKRITAGGASDVFIHGVFRTKNLLIQLGGASDFAGALDVEDLELQQSGSSDAKLSGTVANLQIKVSGASDLKGYNCSVDFLKAIATGASQIEITVQKELDLTASGASDIFYKGKGIVKKQVLSGASSIKSIDK